MLPSRIDHGRVFADIADGMATLLARYDLSTGMLLERMGDPEHVGFDQTWFASRTDRDHHATGPRFAEGRETVTTGPIMDLEDFAVELKRQGVCRAKTRIVWQADRAGHNTHPSHIELLQLDAAVTIHRPGHDRGRQAEIVTLPAGYYLSCVLLDFTFGIAHSTGIPGDEAIATHMQHTHAEATCRTCSTRWHGGMSQRKLTAIGGGAPIDLDNAHGKDEFDRLDCPICGSVSAIDVTFAGGLLTQAA